MMIRTAEASPRLTARVAGIFYLLNVITAFLSLFSFRGLVVSGDPAATATNIVAHGSRFRLGFASEIIATACSIAVTALFYELFKPVNRSLSLLAAFFRLIACAVAAFSYLFHLAPLQILGGAHHLGTLKSEELQALSLLLLSLQPRSINIFIIFFGFHFVLIGYLIFRSTFLPRALGVLAAFAGFGALTFLAPPLGTYLLFPYLAAIFLLCEVSLTLWLVIVGVDVQRWQEQARAAAFRA